MYCVAKKKITLFVMAVIAVVGCMSMAKCDSKAATPNCESYEGSNVEAQNYTHFEGSPMESYLTDCASGSLMRVQWLAERKKILVQYYDEQYNAISSKLVAEELPIFGGFYATDSNYYIFSGQENKGESDNVEVFRLTKYDKNWNKQGSASLYGANTYIPMDFGSSRMASCGKYILIHTCHTMYASSDGLNHQANITIVVDTTTMKVTTDSTRNYYGYVSHSFNQFIKMDNNYIVIVDHGDAYPRSVVLAKIRLDVSTGEFNGVEDREDLLKIYGSVGESGYQWTGASVGGVEISAQAYLVAGNSIVQDGAERKTRNIFVTSTGRSEEGLGATSLRWITNYEEGEDSPSTPQLVKINDNFFVLLWSRNGTIYYTTLNEYGESSGTIYSMEGNLSDCAPIVANGKLVWYTWNNDVMTFYDISIIDPQINHVDVTENGHVLSDEDLEVNDGVATGKCARCGEKLTYNVPIGMSIWWQDQSQEESGYYWSNYASSYTIGEYLKCRYSAVMDMNVADSAYPIKSDITVTVSDEHKMRMELIEGYNTNLLFTMLKPGTVTITFQAKYNPEVKQTFEVVINPAGTKIKSLTAGRKKLKVKWTKNTKHVTGYEIQYSTDRNFAEAETKTVTVKKSKTTSMTLKKLKAKKKYYVRIRTYKSVGGKKYYSDWSKVKSAKTKK